MEQIKRVGRELVFKGSITDYYQDIIELPDGKIVKYDLVDHKGGGSSCSRFGRRKNSDGQTVQECFGQIYS